MTKGNRIQIGGKVDIFQTAKGDIDRYLAKIESYSRISKEHKSWCYEYAIIRLYCAFEELMLAALKAALNRNPADFTKRTNVRIERVRDDLAEYIIVGDGYFDFKGRDGLIKTLRTYLPDDHWLIETIKQEQYKDSLERLSAFRNYAAHSGNSAKARAKKVTRQGKITQAGIWLSKFEGRQTRYAKIADDLYNLSRSVRQKDNARPQGNEG